jgi:hypothetical protein
MAVSASTGSFVRRDESAMPSSVGDQESLMSNLVVWDWSATERSESKKVRK